MSRGYRCRDRRKAIRWKRPDLLIHRNQLSSNQVFHVICTFDRFRHEDSQRLPFDGAACNRHFRFRPGLNAAGTRYLPYEALNVPSCHRLRTGTGAHWPIVLERSAIMSLETGNTIEAGFRRQFVNIATVATRPSLVRFHENVTHEAAPPTDDGVAVEQVKASEHPLLDQWRRRRPEPG